MRSSAAATMHTGDGFARRPEPFVQPSQRPEQFVQPSQTWLQRPHTNDGLRSGMSSTQKSTNQRSLPTSQHTTPKELEERSNCHGYVMTTKEVPRIIQKEVVREE